MSREKENFEKFKEEFEKLTKNGDDVVVITLSSKLSGTFKCAQDASKNFEDKVFVVDSLTAATGERVLCDYALNLIASGKTAEEIVAELEAKKSKIQNPSCHIKNISPKWNSIRGYESVWLYDPLR